MNRQPAGGGVIQGAGSVTSNVAASSESSWGVSSTVWAGPLTTPAGAHAMSGVAASLRSLPDHTVV
jgi:hypothetical protein